MEPDLVGEEVYRQFTRGAVRLRHTAWRKLRNDRDVAEVIAPAPTTRLASTEDPVMEEVADDAVAEVASAAVGGAAKKVTVAVGKRQLTLSNLDKPLYPEGFTKGEVIRFYRLIAPVLLPHLKGRPVTTIRFPDGVGGQKFFERTVGPGPSRRMPDLLVFDLDPGPGTSIVECSRVAERLYDVLVGDGLTPVAKTFGSKGMQVYAGVRVLRRADVGVREGARRAARCRDPGSGDGEDGEEPPTRQGLHRLEPEQPREDDRGAVLPARPRAPDRVHADHPPARRPRFKHSADIPTIGHVR